MSAQTKVWTFGKGWQIVDKATEQVKQALEPGVYELPTGEIYLVKWNRWQTRKYAKRLVEAPSERLTEAGTHSNFDFVFEEDALARIKPEDLMPFERAKQLIVQYGRCLACGRRLKVAESVERGVGPICIKYFKSPVETEGAEA